MLGTSTIVLLIVVFSICHGKSISNLNCAKDDIDFATKIANSSIVVYGKSVGKVLYDGNDSMFHVTYQVDCILKGPTINNKINITNAGRVEGRKYCQDFSVGHDYTIAFLERNPLNVNDSKIFIPSDFVEMLFDSNTTSNLLAHTCNLHRMLPLTSASSLTDACPIVSTDSQCIPTTMKTLLTLSTAAGSPVIVPGRSQHGTDDIRSKSGTIQVDVDTKNGVNSINIHIFLIIMALFVRWY